MGLVEHDEGGPQDEGAGDGHALPLAAGKLVRVSVAAVGVESHLPERRRDDVLPVRGGSGGAVNPQAFFDDLADRQPRAQAAERVLEDDLHLPPQRPQGVRPQALDQGVAEIDGAARGDEAQQRQPQRRLAGAGFSDHADRLAGAHRERQAVDRLHVVDRAAQQAGANGVPDPQVLRAHQGRRFARRGRRAARLRRDEALRVGMVRRLEDAGRGARFHDLAVLHDAHPVGDLAHDGQVVGDEQHRHVEAPLQALEQLQDLRLDGHVERRGGFVGDQQGGLVGQRHGDHDALALAARQLVGKGRQAALGFGQTDQVQQLQGALPRRRLSHPLVQAQGLAELLLDGMQRVQGGHGFLEYHCDAVAAHRAHGGGGGAEQLPPFEPHAAAGVRGGGVGQQLQDAQRGDRLAGAGFADQRHRLALLDGQRQALDGVHGAAFGPEVHRQVLDVQQGSP